MLTKQPIADCSNAGQLRASSNLSFANSLLHFLQSPSQRPGQIE